MIARPQFSAVTFFCEWIHEPGGAPPSYIGHYPNNINLAGEIPPTATSRILTSLGVVTLVTIPADSPIEGFTHVIRGDWDGAINTTHRTERDVLIKEYETAREKGNSYVGYFVRSLIAPFSAPTKQGRLEVIVDVGHGGILAGELFFKAGG